MIEPNKDTQPIADLMDSSITKLKALITVQSPYNNIYTIIPTAEFFNRIGEKRCELDMVRAICREMYRYRRGLIKAVREEG